MPIITELSPVAGTNSDGFADSMVNETLLTATMDTVENCDNNSLKVYRIDRSGGSMQIVDITTDAISGTTNQFKPFGTSAQFSDGDEFLIACDEEVQAMLFEVDAAGVHNAALKVYDSTDGVWASNLLTVTDEGNAFKTTGWHYITVPDNATRKAWTPSNDPDLAMASAKYFRVKLDGIVGGNTPPQLSEIVLIRKTFKWADHTIDINGDTTVAPPASTHYPWAGSILAHCFSNPAYRMEAYMHLVGTSVIDDVHEYLASDNTWKTLTGWANATNDFTVGPTVLGNPVQKLPITWNMPTDWASKAQTFTLNSGSSVTYTGYWIRERTTAITQYGDHLSPRYRLRVRQFGSDNTTGERVFSAQTIKGINIKSITTPPTTDINAEVVNLSTGKASAFVIPANPTLPLALDLNIAFAAGEERGIRVASGGTALAVQYEYAY